MLLIAGLGNPGPQYQKHRHNVGFMAADAIHRRHSFSPWSKKFNALVAEGRIGTEKVLLMKPQTFMNLSGQAVGEAMRFYKLPTSDLIVLYDELDLPPGKVRVKRVRIGIGHPGDKARVSPHVLGDFAKADHEWLDPLLDAVADNVALLAQGDESGFMNKVSLVVQGKAGAAEMTGGGSASKGQSHIRQARPKATAKLPEGGPMAAMLKKLFGSKE